MTALLNVLGLLGPRQTTHLHVLLLYVPEPLTVNSAKEPRPFLSVHYHVTTTAFRFSKKYSDSIFLNESIFSIRFSTSLPYRRIGSYHLLLCCQMSTPLRHSHNFTKTSAGTTGVSSLFRRMQRPNRMADFFNKTNRFAQKMNRRIDSNRESECSRNNLNQYHNRYPTFSGSSVFKRLTLR